MPDNIYVNENYWLYNQQYLYQYSRDIEFTTTNTLTGDFADTYLAGEYIRIQGSRLNDGIYLIDTINDTTITIDATIDQIIRTEPEIGIVLIKAHIPQDLITLISEIKTYNSTGIIPIAGESQGNRSVTYAKDSSWKSVYNGQLSIYKKLGW
ncbi:MAG: hypothetical protein ACTSPI_04735 [Candidatus Heimdallarchaeaceae archaeon]